MVHVLRLISVIAICLTVLACSRERNQWQEPADQPGPAAATPAPTVNEKGERIVLFAPLDPGPLTAIFPEARLDFPYRAAERVDLLLRGHDGRVGETLPDSFAPRWDQGRVAATAGAHVVVLSRVLDLKRHKGSSGTPPIPDSVEALVELRVLDVNGRAIYHKRMQGRSDVATSPKLAAAAAAPESRAAWDALDAGLGSLRTFLAAQNDLSNAPTPATEMNPAALVLVPVVFDVAPAGAEIHVDGIFRGHAPLTLHLPVRELTIRIGLTGHIPWERTLTPADGMKIQPILTVEGGAAPAEEAPAVPAQPVDNEIPVEPAAPAPTPAVEEPAAG